MVSGVLEAASPPREDARKRKRIVVGVSGGSGMPYALDLLQTLQPLPVETHLIVTGGAKQVIPTELSETVLDLEGLADVVHNNRDLGAPVASGSFRAAGMVIVPCSAGTLAKVAQGLTDNLVARAAHVTLKERRPLVLVVREAPFSRPMLQNMLLAHDAGAAVLPASPGFYHRPQTLDELVATVTARALDLLGVDNDRAPRWKEGS
jgi:4-hydroxy-3-polyprenylbenzoate decarboxylase